MVLDLILLFSILNLLALAILFIYAYLNPKEWNEWLVSSFNTYIVIYFWTGSFFLFFLILGAIPFMWPILLLLLVALLWNVKLAYESVGSRSMLPLILYIISLAWVPYSVLKSSDPFAALVFFVAAYVIGAVFVPIVGRLISYPIESMAPKQNQEHIRMIEKRRYAKTFGISSMEFLIKGRYLFPDERPSRMVGMAIAYCIWMMGMILIAPQFGLAIVF